MIAILAAVIGAIVPTIKHMKGQGGCCGSGNESVSKEEEDKVLDGPVTCKKIIEIEGMHCSNCSNSVKRAINKMDGASAKVSLEEGKAEVSMTKEISDMTLRLAIENLNFHVKSISKL
ncbi:MAG: heavy-metal-associated domain-containing protein [Sphaerochaetaceae bacterium]|nr:heavy-metal-associated domain-containing protein [Sphaerochaetaceae bacterium]